MVVQAGAGRAGEAGRGVNAGLSVVPLRQTPLMVTVSGINLANTDNGGRAAALTLTWGGGFSAQLASNHSKQCSDEKQIIH